MSFIRWIEDYSVKGRKGLNHRVRAINVRRAFEFCNPCGGRDNGKYLCLGDSPSKNFYQTSGQRNEVNNCVWYERESGKIVETKMFSVCDGIVKESVSTFTEDEARNLKERERSEVKL